MKTHLTKRLAQNTILVFLGALIISSCATTSVSKRRYTGGFNLEFSFLHKQKSNSKSTANIAKANANQSKIAKAKIEEVKLNSKSIAVIENNINADVASNAVSYKGSAVKSSSKTKVAASTITTAPVVKHSFKNKVSFLLAKHAFNKAVKQKATSSDESKLLYIIIAILLPWLGVLLYEGGVTSHFWITLLLWFLFYFPGLIYAILVITDNI